MSVFRPDRRRPVRTTGAIQNPQPYRSDSDQPSVPSYSGRACYIPEPYPRYEGELADREAAAQEQLAIKRMRVAPLYNKGNYQYVDADINLKDIGRKTSQLDDGD